MSGKHVGRQSLLDEGNDGVRSVQGLPHLGFLWIGWLSRVPVAPRILRQRSRLTQVGLQDGIDGYTLGAELHQIVRLPERSVVPGEEGFKRLLDSLLTVERSVSE